ncbi:restriction endonuclease subunit S [Pseudomonas aeruginosa]|nr:restriction endonuclease subunit S [Pseudomonas aeruginosa]
MANDWRAVSLGELFRVKHGFAFKSEYFTDEPQDTVLVTPGNFAIGGGFQDGKRKYYNGQLPEDYVLKPGQVVVTMTDLSKESDTLGYAASIPNDSTIWLHNQRVGLLEFKTEIPTSPRFIEYLLRTHEYRSWIVGSATGTTVKHTAPGRIESFATRIPPIEEQRAIAHILGTLDNKIELNRRANETLEAMARTLFKAWFVDFEPVRAKMEGRWKRGESLPGLPAHLYDTFPDRLIESELGEIPEGWEMRSLDSIANYLNGLALQKFPPESETEFLPVIKIAQLRAGNTNGADKASTQIKPEYVVVDGDVLFSWSGSLEVEVWNGGRGALNQHLFKVTSNEVPKWFYFFATRQHLSDFRAIAAGKATTMGHIQRKHLTDARIAVAPPESMKKFDAVIASQFDQLVSNAQQSRSLAQLRDTLLPKLISGELRISDAERFLGEVDRA